VWEYVRLLLQQIYEDKDMQALPQDQPPAQGYLTRLEGEIAETRDQLNQMIEDYSKEKRPAVRDIYASKIDRAGERLEILEAQHRTKLQVYHTSETQIAQQQHTLAELLLRGVDAIMADEPAKLNQFLFMLFGKFRIFVENRQIVKLKEVDG
jgi:CHASE3 domain sensor protein